MTFAEGSDGLSQIDLDSGHNARFKKDGFCRPSPEITPAGPLQAAANVLGSPIREEINQHDGEVNIFDVRFNAERDMDGASECQIFFEGSRLVAEDVRSGFQWSLVLDPGLPAEEGPTDRRRGVVRIVIKLERGGFCVRLLPAELALPILRAEKEALDFGRWGWPSVRCSPAFLSGDEVSNLSICGWSRTL